MCLHGRFLGGNEYIAQHPTPLPRMHDISGDHSLPVPLLIFGTLLYVFGLPCIFFAFSFLSDGISSYLCIYTTVNFRCCM